MKPLMPCVLALALFGPAVPVPAERIPLEPGPDTTVYEGPLRADGTVDYVAAINEAMSKGVTAENNAFVALWRVRPESRYAETDGQMAEMLGLDAGALADVEPYIGFFDFMEKTGRSGMEDEPWGVYDIALDGPFVGDDLPEVQAWLARNEAALDLVVSGLARPRFYVPLITDGDEDATIFVAEAATHLPMFRDYAKALMCRAHDAVGEGRLDGAIADLCALRRLGAHLRTRSTFISGLVANSIDAIYIELLQTILACDGLESRHLDQIQRGGSPQLGQPTAAQVLDRVERLYILDLTQMGWADRLDWDDYQMAEMWLGEEEAQYLLGAFTMVLDDRFDINAAMRSMNQLYDELVEVFSIESYGRFVEQFGVYEARLTDALSPKDTDLLVAAAEGKDLGGLSGERLTGVVVEALGTSMILWVDMIRRLEFQTAMQDEMVGVGIALERYRLDHGTYPTGLGALVPGYLPVIPEDLFDGEPLRYVPKAGLAGYLLYSIGRDQVDHGGSEEPEAYDLVFRVERDVAP